jgi:protein TonB
MTVALTPAIPHVEAADDAGGSPTGSPNGVPEGMEGGLEGGMVGGMPGGVIGGVIGGTGTGPIVPVLDYDQGPRLLRQARPEYPHEAFTKKIEGVVVMEILIDDTGRVARMRILQSVPLLDAAALDAVRQWIFVPAVRHGRPVATIAVAPVRFTIY